MVSNHLPIRDAIEHLLARYLEILPLFFAEAYECIKL